MATRTTRVLTLGILWKQAAMNFCGRIGMSHRPLFLTGRFLRVGVWLTAAHMIGTISLLVIYSKERFINSYFSPTLAAQYIIKDIVLVATGMVIAAT